MPIKKRGKSKRTSAVTWLVLFAAAIMVGMLIFMHSEGGMGYNELAIKVKSSAAENIPKIYHSLEAFSTTSSQANPPLEGVGKYLETVEASGSVGANVNGHDIPEVSRGHLNPPDTKQSADRSEIPTTDSAQLIEKSNMIPSPSLVSDTSKHPRKKIAFAITITKDGPFQDGAAVMQYSILKAFEADDLDISFVAFVHPNVSTSRPPLRKIGYRVIEAPTPVNVSAIRGKFLREHINDKAGCCGAAELIKLYAYRLVEFDWVVHLDADVLVTKSFGELFDMDKSLIYTTDPNMASYKGEDKMPVQGGFLVIKPSLADYRRIIDIVVEGDYRGSAAWGGTRIGWFWGGRTIQGVLAYYYTNQTDASRSVRLDRCRYNTMADTDECAAVPMSELKSAHYTVCQKPWKCMRGGFHNNLCKELHARWHDTRKETEKYFNIYTTEASCESRRPGSEKGPLKYTPLHLEKARIPLNPRFEVPPLSGPYDRMDPLPGAGFPDIDSQYHF